MSEAHLTQRAMGAPERKFWGARPLLSGSLAGYRGRLISEVWADGFVCLAMDDPTLLQSAVAGIHQCRPLTGSAYGLPTDGVLLDGPRGGFLGRVIVEFWTGMPPVVAAEGSDTALLLRLTEARLVELAN
jgi:hypothetical protein